MNTAISIRQVKFDTNKIRLFKNSVKFNFTNMSETAGQALRRVRIAKGYNQTELATRSRVSKNYISLLEADKIAQPRLYQIEKIEKALGVGPGEIQTQFSGLAPKKPQTLPELLEALDGLGIAIDWAAFKDGFENYTPDDFEELKEQIAANAGVKIKRITSR